MRTFLPLTAPRTTMNNDRPTDRHQSCCFSIIHVAFVVVVVAILTEGQGIVTVVVVVVVVWACCCCTTTKLLRRFSDILIL